MKTRLFSKADYKALKKYETHFRQAVHSHYATGLLQQEITEIADVYYQTLGRTINRNCGSCILEMLSQVGRMWYAWQKKEQEEKKEQKKKKTKEETIELKQSKIEDNEKTDE